MTGAKRGQAIAPTEEEFPVVFGPLAKVAGATHAMTFALGLMLFGRVELVCGLLRSDFRDDPADSDFGSVSIRAVNKKTRPRLGWMCTWVKDLFKKTEVCFHNRCGDWGSSNPQTPKPIRSNPAVFIIETSNTHLCLWVLIQKPRSIPTYLRDRLGRCFYHVARNRLKGQRVE